MWTDLLGPLLGGLAVRRLAADSAAGRDKIEAAAQYSRERNLVAQTESSELVLVFRYHCASPTMVYSHQAQTLRLVGMKQQMRDLQTRAQKNDLDSECRATANLVASSPADERP